MSSRPSATIEPSILAIPSLMGEADEIHKYVVLLLFWKEVLEDDWFDVHMSERAAEALFADGRYPLREQLTAVLKKYGIEEYDVNTIARMAEDLLRRTPSFEQYYGVSAVLSERQVFEADIHNVVLYDSLREDFVRCVLLMALLRSYRLDPPAGHCFIVPTALARSVRVVALVHDVEHEREELATLLSLPEQLDSNVLMCDEFSGLMNCVDEREILINATEEKSIGLAIRIALFKDYLQSGEDWNWKVENLPTIRRRFRETCQECCAEHGVALAQKTLRSIVNIVRDATQETFHAIRVAVGGGSRQRKEGRIGSKS